MPTRYDAIVIGTGQAGPSLAVRLAKAGRKTAVLERARFGGTCVNAGCIPTKTLVASARAASPDMPGVGDVTFLTSTGILDLDVVPEHLVVVGGSYVGLEFAQMYRRFGSRVTVVE
jgi:pyruvate/2-oxoglutarate dehydrogenase complex dihydrolipoamide dehydrogenase (E3) component